MSLTPRLTEWICIFNFKTILPLIHLVFLFATPNRADTQMSSSSCWFRESWPENIIVREPSSNWSIWRWFTPLQPHRILLLFVRRSKCVYIWNSRVRCFFFPFFLSDSNSLDVKCCFVFKTCFYWFGLRAQFTSWLRFKCEKQTALGHLRPNIKYIPSWPPGFMQ